MFCDELKLFAVFFFLAGLTLRFIEFNFNFKLVTVKYMALYRPAESSYQYIKCISKKRK